jgi:hypothetical protein
MGSKTSCKTARNDYDYGWDLAGAANAGLATGFIAREGQSIHSPPV